MHVQIQPDPVLNSFFRFQPIKYIFHTLGVQFENDWNQKEMSLEYFSTLPDVSRKVSNYKHQVVWALCTPVSQYMTVTEIFKLGFECICTFHQANVSHSSTSVIFAGKSILHSFFLLFLKSFCFHKKIYDPLQQKVPLDPSYMLLKWKLLCDFCPIIWSWTIRTLWSWTINNLEKYSKSNMLQDHIWNQHYSRGI